MLVDNCACGHGSASSTNATERQAEADAVEEPRVPARGDTHRDRAEAIGAFFAG